MGSKPVFTQVIRTTDRGRFKNCRQEWDFASALRMNLEPVRTARPLAFGTLIHTALAAYYDPATPRDMVHGLGAFQIGIDQWRESQADPDSDETWEEYDEMHSLGIGMLAHYEEWSKEKDDFEVVWVEKQYHIPIPGIEGYWYSFKPDGLVKMPNGTYAILEHKTAARVSDTLENFLFIDDQCGSYIWGLQQVGIEVSHVIYNTLRKKAPTPLPELKNGGYSKDRSRDTTYAYAYRQLKQAKEPIEAYADFLDFLRSKGNSFFNRTPVQRNKKEIALLGESITAEVREMINPDVTIYRRPSKDACGYCAFFIPCVTKWEGGDLDMVLAGNYREAQS